MRLKDKVAIVTGAARGIGLACAQRYAAEGAKVVLSDVNAEDGEARTQEIVAEGGEAIFQACDVGDKAAVEAMIARTVEVYGRLDILVANAGIVHAEEFLDLAEEDFDRVIRVNLKGVFLTGQAAARQMVKQGGGGAIVNMSSVNAVMAIPSITPYVVAKGGVNQLTKTMALALADKGTEAALKADHHLLNGLNVCAGQVTDRAVADTFDMEYVDPIVALSRR